MPFTEKNTLTLTWSKADAVGGDGEQEKGSFHSAQAFAAQRPKCPQAQGVGHTHQQVWKQKLGRRECRIAKILILPFEDLEKFYLLSPPFHSEKAL